jgi:hypothetical protein
MKKTIFFTMYYLTASPFVVAKESCRQDVEDTVSTLVNKESPKEIVGGEIKVEAKEIDRDELEGAPFRIYKVSAVSFGDDGKVRNRSSYIVTAAATHVWKDEHSAAANACNIRSISFVGELSGLSKD